MLLNKVEKMIRRTRFKIVMVHLDETSRRFPHHCHTNPFTQRTSGNVTCQTQIIKLNSHAKGLWNTSEACIVTKCLEPIYELISQMKLRHGKVYLAFDKQTFDHYFDYFMFFTRPLSKIKGYCSRR